LRRCARRLGWRRGLSRRSRGTRRPPAGRLPPCAVVGAVCDGQRPRVAGGPRWWSVSGWWLTETAARSSRLDKRRRRWRFGLAAAGVGLGVRGRRRPSAGRRRGVLVVFLRRRALATIGWDEVDRRPRRCRRFGSNGRFGLRCRRLVIRIFWARPAEFSPQGVVAVGHYTSPSLSDDADIGHFQVSITPDQLLRMRGPGCAVTAQQTLSVSRDGRGRAVEVRRWPGNRRMTTAAVRLIEQGVAERPRPRHAAQGRVC